MVEQNHAAKDIANKVTSRVRKHLRPNFGYAAIKYVAKPVMIVLASISEELYRSQIGPMNTFKDWKVILSIHELNLSWLKNCPATLKVVR